MDFTCPQDCVYIATEMGAAVELLFKGDEEGE